MPLSNHAIVEGFASSALLDSVPGALTDEAGGVIKSPVLFLGVVKTGIEYKAPLSGVGWQEC